MKKQILTSLALMTFLGAGMPGRAEEDPRALMLQARALQRRGGGANPQAAAALYRKVIAQVPGSALAQLRLSEAILESGDLEASVAPAVRATELDPRNGEAWAHLALLRYYMSQGSPAALGQASQALKKATHLLPTDPELWTRYAEILETQKDEDGALQAWLTVGRLHPYPTYRGKVLFEYAFERAVELSVKHKRYEARREAVLALVDKPSPDGRHLRMLEELARDQVDAGFMGHAEEEFTLLGRFMPREPAIWENIALIRVRTSRFDTALATLEKAEALHKTMRISFNMGLCLMKVGRLQEAEARWKALLPATLAPEPEDPSLALPVKVLYATCLLMEGRPKDMLKLVRPWPEASANGELASLQAQALLQLGDWKAARAALRDGMKRFPAQDLFRKAALIPAKSFEEGVFFKGDSRGSLTQLDLEAMAVLWSEFNNWEKCLAAVRTARSSAPVRAVDLLLLEATALESLDKSAEAVTVLREAQKLAPANPTLQNNLGYLILVRGGNVEEASRLIEAALDKEPGNPSTLDSWGWALHQQGKYREAEEVLRKAVGLTPYSPEAHRHLGETLLKLDRLQEALDEWERALAFVFPERKELEKQVQELRTRVARSNRQNSVEPVADAPADEPEDEDGEVDPL